MQCKAFVAQFRQQIMSFCRLTLIFLIYSMGLFSWTAFSHNIITFLESSGTIFGVGTKHGRKFTFRVLQFWETEKEGSMENFRRFYIKEL